MKNTIEEYKLLVRLFLLIQGTHVSFTNVYGEFLIIRNLISVTLLKLGDILSDYQDENKQNLFEKDLESINTAIKKSINECSLNPNCKRLIDSNKSYEEKLKLLLKIKFMDNDISDEDKLELLLNQND